MYQIFISFIRIGLYFLLISIYLYYINNYEIVFEDIFKLLITFFLAMIGYFGLGLISSSFIVIFNKGDPIIYLNSVFSFILGGVFYPNEILPEFLAQLSSLIPLTYVIEISRSVFIFEDSMHLNFFNQIFTLTQISFFLLIVGLVSIFISDRIASKKGLYGDL